MRKAVNNLTDAPLTLGGVEIKAKSQRVIRESLISDDEKKAIREIGATLAISFTGITVTKEEDKENENITLPAEYMAYPKEYIKNDGTLNGKPALKGKIEALQEQYGEAILNDVDFKEKCPDANIEAHRVEVGA